MAVTLRPTAGTVVSVSAAAPATFDAAGYTALSWTAADGFDAIGEIGDSYEVGTFDSITSGREKYRAINDAGSFDAAPADDPADAGQVLIKAAFDASKGTSAELLSVRIEDESGIGVYFQCKVAKWSRNYGGASDVQTRMFEAPITPGTVVEY